MTKICVSHNGIYREGSIWVYPKEDVTEIVRKEQKPVTITSCPKCQEKIDRIKKFLSYDPKEERWESGNVGKTNQPTEVAKSNDDGTVTISSISVVVVPPQ